MTKNVNGIDGSHLKNYIERIEKLESDKKNLAEDIKEVFTQAKSYGYDPKIMREVIKIRKTDENELFEKESMLEVYKTALGMSDEDQEIKSEAELTKSADEEQTNDEAA